MKEFIEKLYKFIRNKQQEHKMAKEFDLKIGDRVRLNNGLIEEVFAIFDYEDGRYYQISNHEYPRHGICYYKNGTYIIAGLPGDADYYIKEKLEDKKPLEWVVGGFYENERGDKAELINDLRNRHDVDRFEKLHFIIHGKVETYNKDGRYFDDEASDWDIIDYWGEPKPKLHKKLEKKIRFNDSEQRMGPIDEFLDLYCAQNPHPIYENLLPKTATVKIEIIED